MKWVAFYSRTGTELKQLAYALNRKPDLIVQNKSGVEPSLLPNVVQYFISTSTEGLEYDKLANYINRMFPLEEVIITLHGFMRILPRSFCESFTIYNGHPGLITRYPELRGKDPQSKVLRQLAYPLVGCVIHRCIAEVDAGEVVASKEANNYANTASELDGQLRDMSLALWIEVLAPILGVKQQHEPTPVKKLPMTTSPEISYTTLIEQQYPETCAEYKAVMQRNYELFCRKQYDYGPGNIALGADITKSVNQRTAITGITVRLFDKINRLINLCMRRETTASNEPIDDTFADTCNYAIIAEIVKSGKWGK